VLLRLWLEALDRADKARVAVEAEGMTTKTESTGAVHVHPLVKVEREARAQASKLAAQLGLHHNNGRCDW
jgi:phage terminase small subunit